MDKLYKKDIVFLLALVFFALASFSRFFDEKLHSHTALFPWMKEYDAVIVSTVVYFIIIFVLFVVCIACCREKYKSNIYYLVCFYSTFAFPMFLSADYFGCTDIYAWMLTWIGGILLVTKRFEWMLILISFCIALISPISVFSGVCIILAILIYRFFAKKENRYLGYSIASFVAACIGFMVAKMLGGFDLDAQQVLSLERFAVMVIFMSPYLYIAMKFFGNLVHKAESKQKWGIVCWIIGILPSSIVCIYLQDYARAFFHVFSYFILSVIIHIASGEEPVEEQLENVKEKIKEWSPIPILIIAIPFLFMTLWISGQQFLLTEIFVDN